MMEVDCQLAKLMKAACVREWSESKRALTEADAWLRRLCYE